MPWEETCLNAFDIASKRASYSLETKQQALELVEEFVHFLEKRVLIKNADIFIQIAKEFASNKSIPGKRREENQTSEKGYAPILFFSLTQKDYSRSNPCHQNSFCNSLSKHPQRMIFLLLTKQNIFCLYFHYQFFPCNLHTNNMLHSYPFFQFSTKNRRVLIQWFLIVFVITLVPSIRKKKKSYSCKKKKGLGKD